MHKLYVILAVSICVICGVVFGNVSHALEPSLVISQIKLGDFDSAKNEFIEIYNNSDIDVEITNWCLYYQSLSLTSKKLGCFTAETVASHVFLPARTYAMSTSTEQALLDPFLISDLVFSATLSGAGGYVYLSDTLDVEIDKIGWNTLVGVGDFAAASLPGEVISRKQIEIIQSEEDNLIEVPSVMLQDTNVNIDDFEISPLRDTYVFGQIYELDDLCPNLVDIQVSLTNLYQDEFGDCFEIIDLCPNLDEIQLLIPAGYDLDEFGDCVTDICFNLDGIQSSLPEGMMLDGDNCLDIDLCPNLDEIQAAIPEKYYLNDFGDCMLKLIKLRINELLPNVDGIDDGNEFIELFNPNDFAVDLDNYIFRTDPLSEKFYRLQVGAVILANSYYVIYNSESSFTLKNTTGGVWLYLADDQLVDSVQYENPDEDEAWAYIDEGWSYTNRVTAGEMNLNYLTKPVAMTSEKVDEFEPCGPNQYRNPETNRCKNIVATSSVLVPCKEGQYRSEETNRCRNIVSDVVSYIPCDEGEERNPETNRCRKITTSVLGATTLEPCPEGQERNPETNRCRKVVSDVPEVAYAIEPIEYKGGSETLVWSVGAVSLLAVSYGVWEWRIEIARGFRKVKSFASRNK